MIGLHALKSGQPLIRRNFHMNPKCRIGTWHRHRMGPTSWREKKCTEKDRGRETEREKDEEKMFRILLFHCFLEKFIISIENPLFDFARTRWRTSWSSPFLRRCRSPLLALSCWNVNRKGPERRLNVIHRRASSHSGPPAFK